MDIESMRLDKWLWAARFFKTRSLAQKQIELGRVQVNGNRIKNSFLVKPNDIVDLNLNHLPYKVTIKKLNLQRRPAREAVLLYEEDYDVKVKRENLRALNKATQIVVHYEKGKPSKKERRDLDKFKKNLYKS